MGYVRSRQAALGKQRQTIQTNAAPPFAMQPFTLAECALGARDGDPPEKEEDLDGVASGAMIQFSIDTPPDSGFIQWVVQWGYGGFTNTRIMYAQNGSYRFAGDWFRVSAQIFGATAFSQARVSAFITPAIDGQVRWATLWNPRVVTPVPHLEVVPGGSYVGADSYQIMPVPSTLWRVQGFRYDAGGAPIFVQMYDTATFPIPAGTIPWKSIANIQPAPANQDFQESDILSGREFFQGVTIAASSTAAIYTAVPAALLAVDVELLNQ